MAAADLCGFCNKKTETRSGIRVLRGHTISVSVFRCTSPLCTGRFHAACVREQLGSDKSIMFDCPRCTTRCTARAPASVIGTLLRSMWCQYPTVLPRWPYIGFVVNRCTDMMAFVVGLLWMVFLYSIAPYANQAPGDLFASINWETVDYDVNRMPAEMSKLQNQMMDADNPTLALATSVAPWIVGWVFISVCDGAVRAIWTAIGRRNSGQTAQGVILE